MDQPRTTWGAGDYPLMARRLVPAARAAVAEARIRPGDRVLDLATGTGNAALLAAEQGGRVVGVDFEPVLLQLAEQRASLAGRWICWLDGQLDHLPVPEASYEVVLSVFGVMYAPDHAAAARELARVTAPDGRVVLASWSPGSLLPAMGEVVSDYLAPPPPGGASPGRWGDVEALATLLGACGLRLTKARHRRVTLRFPDAIAGAQFLVRTAGHLMSEEQRLTGTGRWDDLHRDLTTLVERRAENRGDHIELPLDYLLATAVREPGGAAPGQEARRPTRRTLR